MYNEGIDYTAGGEKMTVSKVAIASDHGGIELRKSIISYLESVGISYEEFGPKHQNQWTTRDSLLPLVKKLLTKKLTAAF